MTPPQLPATLQYRPCWDGNAVQHVLEMLSRIGGRVSKNLLKMRRHERMPYVAPVIVSQKTKDRLKKQTKSILPVIGRDLSRAGICLLTPLTFEPQTPDGQQGSLRATDIFRDGVVLDIGLQKANGDWLWVYGTCVRVCTLQHDFLDVGIRLRGRRNLELDFDFI